jgi:2-C-methyl-D-erythritol 4-phosphate cytidylyltransferase
MDPRIAALVPAAGRGERLGLGAPKALTPLAGEPMLVHAVRTLAAGPIDLVVVAIPPGTADDVWAALAGAHGGAGLAVVDGGTTRSESVRRAMATLPDSVEVVLVHDAARPLVPAALVEAVVAAVEGGADAVVPGLPVTDTVKAVDDDGAVVATVDRAALRSVQTPQGFRRAVLAAVYAETGAPEATDDATLVERAGGRVLLIPGAPEAFKVTTAQDLLLAEALIADRRRRRRSNGEPEPERRVRNRAVRD